MKKPVINAADAPTHSGASGVYFSYTMTELASELGARAIGANITRVPPGKAAFPIHHHHANEEHFFVLSGSGVVKNQLGYWEGEDGAQVAAIVARHPRH